MRTGLDLTIFSQDQQMVIVALLEEIERLNERIMALEKKDESRELFVDLRDYLAEAWKED